MVPAALKRGPTTNSRREARTRGYTQRQKSQVTRQRAPLSERQRKGKKKKEKKKSTRPWMENRAIPLRQLMQVCRVTPNHRANSEDAWPEGKGSCNPRSKGRGRGIVVAPERIPQCAKKKKKKRKSFNFGEGMVGGRWKRSWSTQGRWKRP